MIERRRPAKYWLMIGLTLVAWIGATLTAGASVSLQDFRATPLTDTIEVRWQTATESGTTAFRLYRSDSESPADWGAAIHQTASQGDSVIGAIYIYVDGADGNVGNVQPNVRYYYRLEELTSSGSTNVLGVRNAGIGLEVLPTNTATRTPTATLIIVGTATRTRTPVPGSQPTEALPPTATRQFPNTATPVPTATLNPGSAFNSALPTPFPVPTATPIGSASVTSPTPIGGISLPQATPVPLPSPTATPALVAIEVTATPTALTAQLEPAASPTTLLRGQAVITRTPQVFEPNSSADRRATPEAPGSARNSRLPFVLGGGAVALAVLIGVGGFAFWQSRRH